MMIAENDDACIIKANSEILYYLLPLHASIVASSSSCQLHQHTYRHNIITPDTSTHDDTSHHFIVQLTFKFLDNINLFLSLSAEQ